MIAWFYSRKFVELLREKVEGTSSALIELFTFQFSIVGKLDLKQLYGSPLAPYKDAAKLQLREF